MKKTTIVTALAAVLGLALAGTIPALAQNEQPAAEFSAVCPFHDQESVTSPDMEQWMGGADHERWMESTDHDRMHAEMGDIDHMMDGYGAGPGNMMGGMMGAGNMMGFSG